MSHPLESAKSRRKTLATTTSPRTGLDFLVTHRGQVEVPPWSEPVTVDLRYVPDDLVMTADSLRAYLHSLGSGDWQSLEHLGAAMSGDIDAEILPRWLRVRLCTQIAAQEHCVLFEQTKPGWDNRMLLARMKID